MRPSLAVVLIGFCCTVPLSAQSSSPELDRVRAALDKYRDPVVALQDGYLSTLVCVEYPASADAHGGHQAGGMGVHLLNPGPRPQARQLAAAGDHLRASG